MNTEKWTMEVMGYVDPALVEGAARPRRRLSRAARAGLAAACLCLAMTGSVWALDTLLGVRLGETESSFGYSAYDIQAEVERFDLSQFSGDLQADLAAGELRWAHDSWQSALDYVGVPLLYSALLDEAAMGAGMNAPYVVDGTLTADQERLPGEEAGRPEQIRLAFSRVVDNVVVAVYIHLYTQYADPEELAEGVPGRAWIGPYKVYREGPDGSRTQVGQSSVEMEFASHGYEMACGETATIVTAREANGQESYQGCFVHDGVLYEVNAIGLASKANVVPDFLKLTERLLDSFAPPEEGEDALSSLTSAENLI